MIEITDAEAHAIVDRLSAAGCVDAEREAATFLAAAPDPATLDEWIRRREQGEPPGWITGTVVFCGRELHLAPGVYVPRPQSEVLARRAAALLPPHGSALDMCTGSGAVAAHLSAQVPTATVIGTDRDIRAARCARRNGVHAIVADLAASVRHAATFDVVTAVAPYVPSEAIAFLPRDVQRWEPRFALDGGDDGLELVRRVIEAAGQRLRPGGWLLIEVAADQDRDLAESLTINAFDQIETWRDDDGDLRGIVARHTSPLGSDPTCDVSD